MNHSQFFTGCMENRWSESLKKKEKMKGISQTFIEILVKYL